MTELPSSSVPSYDRVRAVEWLAEMVWAFMRTPWTWEGAVRSVHPHVWQAVIFGGIITSLPIYLVFTRPG